VEEQESLETGAHVSQLPDPVQDQVHDLLTDGVVAPGVVVGSVLLAVDQLLRVEELAVGSTPGLVDDRGLEIDEDGPGHVFAGSSLGKEGCEGIVSEGLVGGHVAVGLDAMLQAVELPAGVTDLATRLPYVHRDTFTHIEVLKCRKSF